MAGLIEKNGVKIHPTAEVNENAKIGQGTYIWNYVQVREKTSIGKNCILSKDVYIDFDVVIGDRVKIQNGVSVYHGVVIEEDVFLGPHMVFTNDLFPRSFVVDFKVYPTIIKRGASIGANATIICGNSLGEYCMVGAGSVVTKSVPAYSLVVGNPARVIAFVCKCGQKTKMVSENNENVTLQCIICKELISVSKENYALIGKKL